MGKNIYPRYTIRGNHNTDGGAGTTMAPTLTTAAADYDGSSSNNKLVFTADPTNGSTLTGIHFESKGTNVASLARIYLNNGSANTTGTNNTLIGKIVLPATTASNTQPEAATSFYFENGKIDLQAGTRIYVGLATTVSAGWVPTPISGGDM